MNMKKAIAGLVAGVVVVSAMAMTTVSAKEVSYAAVEKNYATSVSGYAQKDKTITYTVTRKAAAALTGTVAGQLTFTSPAGVGNTVKSAKITIKPAGAIKGMEVEGTAHVVSSVVVPNVFDFSAAFGGTDYVAAAGEYTLTVEYVIAKSTTLFSSADAATATKYDVTATSTGADTILEDELTAALGAGVRENAKFDSESSTNYALQLKNVDYAGTDADIIKMDASFGLNAKLPGLVSNNIAKVLEGRTKAKIILNFEDPKTTNNSATSLNYGLWSTDPTISSTQVMLTASGMNFTNVAKVASFDSSNYTATFDWGEMTKALTSNKNLNDLSYDLADLNVSFKSSVSGLNTLKLKSVTVKGDAETRADLSAGESSSDSAAEVTTAATTAAVTTAATTAAATNPGTGNAPIALAVIPVAIAAAAIIAKKRG